MKTFVEEMTWRGMISESTAGLAELMETTKIKAYIGFDPTAPSLHVGSLLPLIALMWLQYYGHTPIALTGEATALIGDPSGKTLERQLLTREKVQENRQALYEQISRFLDFKAEANPAHLINNAEWLSPITLIDFLRDVGKHFTINYMLGKESVKRRLEQADGLSFTEFAYMMLQAYDFLVLNQGVGCVLQLGGSDQWGNITAGIELIRKVTGGQAHGLVMPLVTTANGVKFGKTEAGAVWLDPELTSPFEFYQFWLNTHDQDLVKYLKFFTFLSQEEIAEFERLTQTQPEKREAQRALAREVTCLVHGEEHLRKAEQASSILFGGEFGDLASAELLAIFGKVPTTALCSASFATEGEPLTNLLVECGLVKSRNEARRMVQGGGIYLNNHKVTDSQYMVTLTDTIEGKFIVLRKGQKQFHLVALTG
jgi:tyrosyl-tRNA synthetase